MSGVQIPREDRPAALKAAVLAALRSGEYAQTCGNLRRQDCFCVLGVVADVAIKLGADVAWQDEGIRQGRDVVYTFLPTPMLWEWWPDLDAVVQIKTLPEDLQGRLSPRLLARGSAGIAYMNDEGTSFAVLADVIEAAL